MQPRLTRSRTESIVAGVCGGLGEYFAVDPVIVRLIFVLVTLTTGIGVLVYPVLWAVMPKAAPAPPFGGVPGNHTFGQTDAQAGYSAQEANARQTVAARGAGAPPSWQAGSIPRSQYNFDPITGEPIERDDATTGQTVQLDDPMQHPMTPGGQPGYAPTPSRRWRWMGFALLAIGVLALADSFGINTDILFPIMMIGIGVLLLRRRA